MVSALARLIPRYMPDSVMQIVEGGVSAVESLLATTWDHIFYTGSGPIGRKVALAAAEHMTPVTLELGGKCPAYVHESANVKIAARRIVWGKFMNAGQVCISPDYVLVDCKVQDEFEQDAIAAITKFYGEEPSESADFARIINRRHFDRITSLKVSAGGRLVAGGETDPESLYIAPTVIADPAPESALLHDEIFGPVLPIVGVGDDAEALSFILERGAPLAAYPFAKDKVVLERFERECRTGAVVSNDVIVNHAVRSLPFGGIGPSGYGTYHGIHGFRTFSHAKAILRRGTGSDPDLRYPPYDNKKMRWLRRLG
ncbi:MAG: aldehyde dehydrogenase family protein [Pontixanthobacter sp.]